MDYRKQTIQQLTNEAITLENDDLIPVYQNGATKKISARNFFKNHSSGLTEQLENELNDVKKQQENALNDVKKQLENELNDVKEYVNNSNSYSTNEIKTGGKWIDGKPIYRKVVDIGTLPSKGIKMVLHNIQNLNKVLEAKLVAGDGANNLVCNSGSLEIQVRISRENVTVMTNNNYFGYSGYAILEYTKTTD